jgi:hypothetical protein
MVELREKAEKTERSNRGGGGIQHFLDLSALFVFSVLSVLPPGR